MAPPKTDNDTSTKCTMHPKHENQISSLEDNMEKAQTDIQRLKETKADKTAVAEAKADIQTIKDKQQDPRIYVALIGFVAVCMSTVGSICAVVITAYFKIGAPTP